MSTFHFLLVALLFTVVAPERGTAQQVPPVVQRRVLFEEYTGSWCAPCVKTGRITQELLDRYNGRVIPVSLHMGRRRDSMAIKETDSLANVFFLPLGGIPTEFLDRTEDSVESRLAVPAAVAVDIEHTYSPATRLVTATVAARFLEPPAGDDIRITLYVVEDSVTGPEDWYNQQNGENEDPSSPYYGLGEWITGYRHRFVLRAVPSGVHGTAGVIPSIPDIGKRYSYTYRYTLPEKFDQNQVRLVAFLSHPIGGWENSGADVLNATDASLMSSLSSVPEPAPAAFDLAVTPMPLGATGSLQLALPAPGDVNIRLCDMMGTARLSIATGTMRQGRHLLPIDVAGLPNGAYALLVTVNGRTTARNVIVAR